MTMAAALSAFSFHCIICFDDFDSELNYPVVLPCGHTYVCINCANRLDKCMECRTPLDVKVGAAGTQNAPLQRGTSALPLQRRPHQNRYYGPNKSSPTPVIVTKRLPLPKNAVLLSLIQASEPARRRSSLLPAADDNPPLPSPDGIKDVTEAISIVALKSPLKTTEPCCNNQEELLESSPLLSKRNSTQNDDNSSAHDVQPISTRGSILFPTLTLPGDQTSASTTVTTTMVRMSDGVNAASMQDTKENWNEANQMEMELNPMNQVCGTYAVADVDGLVIYPSLVELHRAATSGKDEDDNTERIDNPHAAAGEEQVEDETSIDDDQVQVLSVRHDQHSLYNRVGSTRSSAAGDGKDQVVVEALSIDDDHHEEEDNISTECNIGFSIGKCESCIQSNDDEWNELRNALLIGSTITLDEESPSLAECSNQLRDSIAMKGGTSEKDDTIVETEMTTFLTEDGEKEGDDYAHNKEGNASSSAPAQEESEKPLLRLKYGDRVQVVSSHPRGEWVKLARGYGYIRLKHDKQLVKVGGAFDRACQIESALNELSIDRDLLKHEQKKLEQLAASLMIDLQSTLLTSDDHVICSPPKGFLHDTDSDSCGSDRNRKSCFLDDVEQMTIMHETNNEVAEEAMNTPLSCPRMIKAPVFAARSHYSTEQVDLSTMGQSQQIITPVTPKKEVNWRTGLSGHRALTNSHSPHPHDLISASHVRLMSNHAGVSKSKQSRPRASLY